MAKFYFHESDDERCYTMKYWLEYMQENDLESLELSEAERMINTEFFYCKYYCEAGLKGEGCGKDCEAYAPRNGKNGRCKYSENCYEATDNKIVIFSDKEILTSQP